MDYAALRADVREAASRVADLLRSAPSGDGRVPGSDWTIADIGAHLVTVARRNIGVAGGGSFPWDPGDAPHDAMAAYNDKEIAELGERDLTTLADLLIQTTGVALDAYGDDGDRVVHWPQYQTTARQSSAVYLGELLVHGLDVAEAIGRPWAITGDEAAAIFDGLLPALSLYANRDAASAAAGTYHVRLRGDGDYTIDARADGTVVSRTAAPIRADLHISADPLAYLLVGYGRMSQWRAIARGRIFAWGRKPWLALRFADLFERP